MDPEIEKILAKYEKKLEKNIEVEEHISRPTFSSEYKIFREESLSKSRSFYEKLCNFIESVIKIKPNKKIEDKLRESIETIHLDITPTGSSSFAFFIAMVLIFVALLILGISFLFGSLNMGLILLSLLLILISVIAIKPLTNIPIYLASRWRLKASNQMVLCILYIIIYMRHTSNLEHAIKFASDHINPPLSLDLRKVFWDVETRKYDTIKASLDAYLKKWRDYNLEFVEAFHLIQSSLYEPNEDRRITLLEKALEVILTGTYENMLHYAQGLSSPITMLHMLGIVLPILGLVILPLLGSLMDINGLIKVLGLVILYNILIPIVVFILGANILSKRPTGYNDVELYDEKSLNKYKNILIKIGDKELKLNPFLICFVIGIIVVFIGLIPLILHFINPSFDFAFKELRFIDYRLKGGTVCSSGEACYGPFGFGSVLLSLFIPLGIAFGLGTYYYLRTRKLIKIRNETKKLEKEFSGGLFQLGNRIGDGIPTEIAFGDVSQTMAGTPTGNFFQLVNYNIRKLGMDINEAIFNQKNGAIWKYPSTLVDTSMRVLVESAKKGPQVVARSLINISNYVSRVHDVSERLKDLLADVISSMKSQVNFLTPIIAGIVVGISSMIVTILIRLTGLMTEQTQEGLTGTTISTPLVGLTDLFKIQNIIPPYFLQIVVGVFVVEIIMILTMLINNIENGPDKLNEKNLMGKNLYMGLLLYFGVSFIVTVVFTILASAINII